MKIVHTFVSHYLATKKAPGIEKFCEAALSLDSTLVKEIEQFLPKGTAENYISKIRSLREFVGLHPGLCFLRAEELADVLRRRGVRRVNDISRRVFEGYYVAPRLSSGRVEEVLATLQELDAKELLYLRQFIDGLLMQDETGVRGKIGNGK